MADITERIKNRKDKEEKEKKGNPSKLPESKKPQVEKEQPLPASGDKNTPDAMPSAPSQQQPTAPSQQSRMVSEAPNPMDKTATSLIGAATVPETPPKLESNVSPDFVRLGYDEWAKQHPNTSRGEYAYALSNYRRKNGQPDLSYAEWQNIIKGNNPWETEADKKKRERREKAAFLIDGVGGLLGNIVNYVRAKNGHVAMPGFDVGKAYDRLNLLRQGQERIANRNYQAYMDAIVRDRAERTKKETEAASRAMAEQKAQRDYEYRLGQLQIQMMNANTAAEKAKLEAEARRVKAEHDRKYDALRFSETVRHNKETERNSYGKVATSASTAGGKIMTRSTPLSQQEAKLIVERYYDKETPVDKLYEMKGSDGKKNGKTNWIEAAEDILSDQIVDPEFLERLGYRISGDDVSQIKYVQGYGDSQPVTKKVSGYG